MKIKNDFVTNSSSTNFFFVFKGPRCVKSLVSAIWNHRKSFKLSYYVDETSNWSCQCEDIINDIEGSIKKSLGKNNWNDVKISTVDKKILEVEKEIESEKNFYDKSPDKYVKENIRHLEKQKAKFQEAKDGGFENLLEMEWGDNHGDISGGETGYAMDYEGRRIRINSDDLIVFTEQNR